MLGNTKLNPIVTELFITDKKLKFTIPQFFLALPK